MKIKFDMPFYKYILQCDKDIKKLPFYVFFYGCRDEKQKMCSGDLWCHVEVEWMQNC